MFGLSIAEIIVILVVALIVLGPDKLPEIARTIGKTLAEFRRTVDQIKYDIGSIDDEPGKVSSRPLVVADLKAEPEDLNCEQRAQVETQSSASPPPAGSGEEEPKSKDPA